MFFIVFELPILRQLLFNSLKLTFDRGREQEVFPSVYTPVMTVFDKLLLFYLYIIEESHLLYL